MRCFGESHVPLLGLAAALFLMGGAAGATEQPPPVPPPPVPLPTGPSVRRPRQPTHKRNGGREAPRPRGKSTQQVLYKYRDDIEETYRKFPRDDQKSARRELLVVARQRYNLALRKAVPPKKTISQLFDTLIDNLTSARTAFRFRNPERMRIAWLQEAARTFVLEVKHATDLKKKIPPKVWFEQFAQMIKRLQIKANATKGLGGRILPIVNPIFNLVTKARGIPANPHSSDDLQENMLLARKLFPTKTKEQKKAYGSVHKMMERHALQIMKEESKKNNGR